MLFQGEYKPSPSECRDMKNYLEWDEWYQEQIRNRTSSRVAAAEGNAMLRCLRKNGALNQEFLDRFDENQILPSKLNYGKNKLRRQSVQHHTESVEAVVCMGIDGKTDPTGYNLTFTDETNRDGSRGKYLFHSEFDKEPTGRAMAEEAFEVLKAFNSENTILAIAVDNTSVNTGHKKGAVTCLCEENLIGRPLMMIGCAFHAAEPIFRNIFTQIDGPSKGPEKFSEPIGSCIDGDIHEIEPVNFKRIPNLFDIKIPERV